MCWFWAPCLGGMRRTVALGAKQRVKLKGHGDTAFKVWNRIQNVWESIGFSCCRQFFTRLQQSCLELAFSDVYVAGGVISGTSMRSRSSQKARWFRIMVSFSNQHM